MSETSVPAEQSELGNGASAVPAEKRGERKTREGLVVSDKMDKTIVVGWRTG